MTNKEAIERLKWVKKRICDITYSPESFEALDLAIKALEERPKVKWIEFDDGSVACPVCGTGTSIKSIPSVVFFRYCPNCGARMEADND